MNKTKIPRDWIGSSFGLAIFLLGVGLLGFTFFLAFQLYQVPPRAALGMKEGQPIDFNNLGAQTFALLAQIVLLVFMAALGSVIATRGVAMYGKCRSATIAAATEDSL